MRIQDSKIKRKLRSKPSSKGTSMNPRLSVFRSNRYIYVQAIDDLAGHTIASFSSKNLSDNKKISKVDQSHEVGKGIGTKLKKIGVKQVYFDRSGYKYHGRIRVLAESIRESGIIILENMFQEQDSYKIEEEILKIRRVSTKRAGGSSFHFSALSVAGDRNGSVGIAIAKAKENLTAITKSKEKARNSMIKVPITENKSIPHEVYVKEGAAKILLRPAPLGAGIIAGGSVRQILELAGITNISAKIIGTNNQINNAYALMKALKSLKEKETKNG